MAPTASGDGLALSTEGYVQKLRKYAFRSQQTEIVSTVTEVSEVQLRQIRKRKATTGSPVQTETKLTKRQSKIVSIKTTTKRQRSDGSGSHGQRKSPPLVGFPSITPSTLGLSHVVPHSLILGSMPGVTSLEKQEYYGYKQNAFWKIVGTAFKFDADTISYEEKTTKLVASGFILWDVLYGCERKGSLDSNIKSEVPNKLEELVVDLFPSVTRIFLNGKAAAGFFKRHFKDWLDSGCFIFGNETAREFFSPSKTSSRRDADKAIMPTSTAKSSRKPKSVALYIMPSTSPANASMRYAEKELIWMSSCFDVLS